MSHQLEMRWLREKPVQDPIISKYPKYHARATTTELVDIMKRFIF